MTHALSVCVIQFTSRPHLLRCLDALRVQPHANVEIIVPYDDDFADPQQARAAFPGVHWLHVAGRRTPAELRAAAAQSTSAAVVAFLEDHCIPAPDWVERVLAAHQQPHAAVGGAVDKGFLPGTRDDTALNWAVYLTDYSRYMNPQPAGPAHSLTDCNVSYKRAALDGIREAWQAEFHENIVNELLAQRGETLWLSPDVVVYEQRPLTLGIALRDRYAFGRLFASTRVTGSPLVRRFMFAAAALLMPPVLVMRVARNVRTRGRYGTQFVRALPALALVTTTWMLGESIGYLTGSAAASLRSSPGAALAKDAAAPHAAERNAG